MSKYAKRFRKRLSPAKRSKLVDLTTAYPQTASAVATDQQHRHQRLSLRVSTPSAVAELQKFLRGSR